jgi:hypothetical protein
MTMKLYLIFLHVRGTAFDWADLIGVADTRKKAEEIVEGKIYLTYDTENTCTIQKMYDLEVALDLESLS